MKKNIYFIILFSTLLASCNFYTGNITEKKYFPPKDLSPIDVIILSGQSNASGVAVYTDLKVTLSTEEYELFENGIPNTQIINLYPKTESKSPNSDELYFLEPVKLGLGAMENPFCYMGPEIGLQILFIKIIIP